MQGNFVLKIIVGLLLAGMFAVAFNIIGGMMSNQAGKVIRAL